jgi:hypothetical protein
MALQAEEKDALEKLRKELDAEQALARMHHAEAESLAEKVFFLASTLSAHS